MMGNLDSENIICSQTSACVSQIPEPSFVLIAMGLDAGEAFSSLRFSFSSLNTMDEAKVAAEKVIKVYNKAKYLQDYKVWLEFNNGKSGEVDLESHLWGSVFVPLKNIEEFNKFYNFQ